MQAEDAAAASDQTAQRVDPVCGAERTPREFLPWLHLMGYTQATLRALVYTR
ncbi:hypothetical protein [Krasilnikovia cinnamomea]|uniref:hypothetical protein n=1 Tax=Krasilnikovia cinnamomea TaxID=349313 RepID=UPI0013EEF136|nr:hypothetical protein [Krasilnikovia cinnamomea]